MHCFYAICDFKLLFYILILQCRMLFYFIIYKYDFILQRMYTIFQYIILFNYLFVVYVYSFTRLFAYSYLTLLLESICYCFKTYFAVVRNLDACKTGTTPCFSVTVTRSMLSSIPLRTYAFFLPVESYPHVQKDA